MTSAWLLMTHDVRSHIELLVWVEKLKIYALVLVWWHSKVPLFLKYIEFVQLYNVNTFFSTAFCDAFWVCFQSPCSMAMFRLLWSNDSMVHM